MLTEDFLAHLGRYPVAVIERAIERGQREWQYRPSIAHMVEQCDRALRDMPKPERQDAPFDAKNTLGGYTSWRRVDLARAWGESHAKLVSEAKADGWYFALWNCVEDGANILAQTEWHQRQNPGYRPPPWHQVNVAYDPVRGWSIHIAADKLTRWRNAKNVVPIKLPTFREALDEVVRDAGAARDARAAE